MTIPMYDTLLHGMSATVLRFKVRATQTIALTGQPGSAIRGALYSVLSDNFCTEHGSPSDEMHRQTCPVCWMLAAGQSDARGGGDLVRPLTIQPPKPKRYFAGQHFSFGITLIGRAQNMLPYIARAVERMGVVGLGPGRGHFELVSISEYSPLYDAQRVLMREGIVQKPTLQMTTARVNESAKALGGRVVVELLSPLRLIENGGLVKKPEPLPFIARLADRIEKLAIHYAETDQPPDAEQWRAAYDQVKATAATWHVVDDDTSWAEHFSGSRRQGRATPISGLIGRFCLEGDFTPAAELLLWGQALHVGKDAVKGNGSYRLLW